MTRRRPAAVAHRDAPSMLVGRRTPEAMPLPPNTTARPLRSRFPHQTYISALGERHRRASGPPQRPRQGRTGELVALRQLLQACNRGVHSALAPLIARLAEHLTSTPVPSPTP